MRMTMGELRQIIRETIEEEISLEEGWFGFGKKSPEEEERHRIEDEEAEKRAKTGLRFIPRPKGMDSQAAEDAYEERELSHARRNMSFADKAKAFFTGGTPAEKQRKEKLAKRQAEKDKVANLDKEIRKGLKPMSPDQAKKADKGMTMSDLERILGKKS